MPLGSKIANVVEEILVGKEISEHDEVIRRTIRKTEVDVENLGPTDPSICPAGRNSDAVTYSTKYYGIVTSMKQWLSEAQTLVLLADKRN